VKTALPNLLSGALPLSPTNADHGQADAIPAGRAQFPRPSSPACRRRRVPLCLIYNWDGRLRVCQSPGSGRQELGGHSVITMKTSTQNMPCRAWGVDGLQRGIEIHVVGREKYPDVFMSFPKVPEIAIKCWKYKKCVFDKTSLK